MAGGKTKAATAEPKKNIETALVEALEANDIVFDPAHAKHPHKDNRLAGVLFKLALDHGRTLKGSHSAEKRAAVGVREALRAKDRLAALVQKLKDAEGQNVSEREYDYKRPMGREEQSGATYRTLFEAAQIIADLGMTAKFGAVAVLMTPPAASRGVARDDIQKLWNKLKNYGRADEGSVFFTDLDDDDRARVEALLKKMGKKKD